MIIIIFTLQAVTIAILLWDWWRWARKGPE